MGLIAIYKTERNEYGYRTIPLSFEYSWKVGDRIKTEDGKESCTIEIITVGTKKNLETLRNHINNKKTFQTPKLVIYDKKISIEEQIKALKVEANTTKGKQLMYQYQCTADDLCIDNINECFTKIVTSGESYFCRIIRRTDENEMTEADLRKVIPSEYFIYGPILSLFERDYKNDNYCEGFGFIKDDIEYTLQLVHSLSLESILKRLRMYKGELAKRTLIELKKEKTDKKINQAKIIKVQAEEEAELLIKKKELTVKRGKILKEKDLKKENVENITTKKRRNRISK